MATTVLTVNPTFVLTHRIRREFIINELGDGWVQQMTSEAAATRYDGSGNSTSHKGLHIFHVNWRGIHKTQANTLWSFLLARLNSNNEDFYFYNPEEASIDATMHNTVGRYEVRLANPNEALSRENFAWCVFDVGTMEFIEERDPVS